MTQAPSILRHPSLRLALPALSLGLAACGGGAPGAGGATPVADAPATEAEWRALATPRPAPLEDAARLTVGGVEILASPDWSLAPGVPPSLAVAELASAGLLRRQDVRFVERRRFAAAAEAERRGLSRAEGAPAAGVSPGAELAVHATWASVGLDSAFLELRLVRTADGEVAATRRIATATDADPVSLGRMMVGGARAMLEELGRVPAWEDPVEGAAPTGWRPAAVPEAARAAFARGLAAEERWDWEEARRGYQAALDAAPGFFEAQTALARAARLRTGGTLGEG